MRGIGAGEVAAAQERHAERREVSRRDPDDVELDGHVDLGDGGAGAKVFAHAARGHRQDAGQGRGLHTGQGPRALEDPRK